jgi:hypothetical protein
MVQRQTVLPASTVSSIATRTKERGKGDGSVCLPGSCALTLNKLGVNTLGGLPFRASLHFGLGSGIGAVVMPCRVACLGDSHTQGDDWPGWPKDPGVKALDRAGPWLFSTCRLGAPYCRGNYPRLLQGLLGAQFDVRNYGRTGRSVADFVPCPRLTHTMASQSRVPTRRSECPVPSAH